MAVSAHHNLGTVRAKKMIGKCPAWEGTLRNFNLACLTLCFYVHFFSLSMTGKKKEKIYSLNSKRERFVGYRGQKCVRGSYCILHVAAYVQREQEREREEMKQPSCQRIKMWQIIYAPPFKGKVHIHI